MPLRIGFICVADPDDPNALSGTPFRMRRALEGTGAIVTPITPVGPGPKVAPGVATAAPKSKLGFLPPSIKRSIRHFIHEAKLTRDRFQAERTYQQHMAAARSHSHAISASIHDDQFDVLFGFCCSPSICKLTSKLPLVYFSDATARVLNRTYPYNIKRGRGYQRACDELETTALARATFACYGAEWARQSAIHDYGMNESRVHVVPLGANVTPDPAQAAALNPEPPTPEHLELCIVAIDPVRKRLDLAIETTELLNRRGIKATLNFVGPPTPRAEHSPVVNCLGRLRLSEPADRVKHCAMLARSHLMILPSTNEAFGIAPCESAHFGRPSIVNDVGGLPTIVLHDQTGIVMPTSAGAANYAAAIDELVGDPQRYRRMSQAALTRARQVLNWESWAGSMMELLKSATLHAART